MSAESFVPMMILCFTSLSTQFKSYQDDGRMIMKGSVCLFVLRFYGPVNPMGSCQARSVFLRTLLLGRLSPLSD